MILMQTMEKSDRSRHSNSNSSYKGKYKEIYETPRISPPNTIVKNVAMVIKTPNAIIAQATMAALGRPAISRVRDAACFAFTISGVELDPLQDLRPFECFRLIRAKT